MADLGEALSERELDVLRCVAKGAANKEIAAELGISQNTVKVHLRNIFVKLGVASRAEAIMVALQQGLVTLPGSVGVPFIAEEEPLEETPVAKPLPEAPVLPLQVVPPPDSQPQPLPETAVSLSPPPSNNRRWLLLTLFILVALVATAGYWATQAFSGQPTPTPVSFTEQPIGDDIHWAQLPAMPIPQAGMAAAAVGLNVYYIGGETAENVVGDVQVYDTAEHTWSQLATKPTAVADASAVVLFGEIYVVGGRLDDGTPTDIVEVYSPTNDAWRQIQSLPQPIAGGLALTDGNFLYFVGGWDGNNYLDTAYVYDAGSGLWRPLPPLGQARAFAVGGQLTGALYVVGGFDGQALAVCQFFVPATQTWQECPPLLQPRAGAGATVVVNKLYVFGGGLAEGGEITFSESYDPATQTWQIINTPLFANNTTWSHFGVAHIETRIFLAGGRQNGELTADTFAYTALYQTYLPAFSKDEE